MTIKQERIQELIRTHLSDLLLTTVTDPALQGVTVTDVAVNREIEHADIYVHALGDDSREEAVMQGLERAAGFLRSNLAVAAADSADARPAFSLGSYTGRRRPHRRPAGIRQGRLAGQRRRFIG